MQILIGYGCSGRPCRQTVAKCQHRRCALAHRHQTLSVQRCWSGHAQPFRDQRQGTANSQQSRGSLMRNSAAAAAAPDVVTLLPRLEYQPDASHPSGQHSSAAFGEPLAGSAAPLGATLLPEQVHGNWVDQTQLHMLPDLNSSAEGCRPCLISSVLVRSLATCAAGCD